MVNTTFGQWLKQRRETLNLSDADVAQQMGDGPETIQQIEADQQRPSPQQLDQLASALDLPAAIVRARYLQETGGEALKQRDYEQAQSALEESLSLYREQDNKQGIASVLNSLGRVLADKGDYDRSIQVFEEYLDVQKQSAPPPAVLMAFNNLGLVQLRKGDYARSEAVYAEGLDRARQLGNKQALSLFLSNYGYVIMRQGDIQRAKGVLEESLAVRRELNNKRGIGESLVYLAEIALEEQDEQKALALTAESLANSQEAANQEGIAEALESFASIAAARGAGERAARLFGAAETIRDAIDEPVPPSRRQSYNDSVNMIRAQLDEAAFTAAWSDGRAMSTEQATACALANS